MVMKMLKMWYERDLARFASFDDSAQSLGECGEPGNITATIRIYTETNGYTIRAGKRDGSDGYLGCTVSSRKPRAGEGWTRGRDLADGLLNEDTWRRILADIVSYEIVRVHRRHGAETPTIGETRQDLPPAA